ncbi:virulence factor Mce [Aeromicrobium sp. A1-2]|uniref:MCE family protein n=1 Tax=Aeromicrobium sp. A1-2 TaxID=2107713 RepID=UPI000E480E73|nr:MCE family protein [Aeromicrobium sp. A1-2]AXT84358.1 virulence factor Mce [Aeromicrobium sp. A1-2]
MNSRDTAFTLVAIRFGIFTIVSFLVTGMLVAIMGGFGLGSQTEYKAIFSSASEIAAGDDVRIAGVVVGKVKDVKIYQRKNALVTFKVKDDVPLTKESEANIRFLNLIGSRYMSLSEGDSGAPRLAPGSTMPMSRTTPSLNLTDLFQGFQPLFAALQPEDVNKLSLNLVRVLQGEGGTVQELLASTASLTNTLADRDQLVGEVITNLSTLMGTVDDHHQELDTLIVSMREWFGDLAKDRKVIGSSLTNISDLTQSVADLLTSGRPLLKADVAELRRLFTVLAEPDNKAYLDRTLDLLPDMLSKQTRIGVYGSWYNYYLCEFHGGVILPSVVMNSLPESAQQALADFSLYSKAKRCQS